MCSSSILFPSSLTVYSPSEEPPNLTLDEMATIVEVLPTSQTSIFNKIAKRITHLLNSQFSDRIVSIAACFANFVHSQKHLIDFPKEELFEAIAYQVETHVHSISAHEKVQIVQAFAKARIHDPLLFNTLSESLVYSLKILSPHELSELATSFLVLGFKDHKQQLFQKIMNEQKNANF